MVWQTNLVHVRYSSQSAIELQCLPYCSQRVYRVSLRTITCTGKILDIVFLYTFSLRSVVIRSYLRPPFVQRVIDLEVEGHSL